MSDYARTYAQMLEQGAAMLKAFNPALESFVPEGWDKLMPTMPAEMMEAMFGNAFNEGGLDARTRLLVTLGALVAAGAPETGQIRLAVRHALAAGATEKEIAETIWQGSMLGGAPALTRALEAAREVFEETGEGSA